ncbi:unnamed protein product, partial [Symbiodinium pilosum]
SCQMVRRCIAIEAYVLPFGRPLGIRSLHRLVVPTSCPGIAQKLQRFLSKCPQQWLVLCWMFDVYAQSSLKWTNDGGRAVNMLLPAALLFCLRCIDTFLAFPMWCACSHLLH